MFIGPGPGLPLLFAHLAHQQYTKNGTSYRPTHKRRTEQKKMTRKMTRITLAPGLRFVLVTSAISQKIWQTVKLKGSGCDSVVRVATYDTRGPRFESSQRQNLY